MNYMGSKRKIAKEILPIILKDRKPGQWYVEPFCGGCNTLEHVGGKRMAGDVHPELIAMYKAMQKGWRPPEFVSEEYYKEVKEKGSPELKGFVGFGYSFGNKYFGGYRRVASIYGYNSKGEQNINGFITSQLVLSMWQRQSKALKGVRFYNLPYYDLPIPPKSIVYCDPPYAGTSEYKTIKFNSDNFWLWAKHMASEGHTVFVSEYNGPVKPIWEKKVSTQLSRTKSENKIEKLFKL